MTQQCYVREPQTVTSFTDHCHICYVPIDTAVVYKSCLPTTHIHHRYSMHTCSIISVTYWSVPEVTPVTVIANTCKCVYAPPMIACSGPGVTLSTQVLCKTAHVWCAVHCFPGHTYLGICLTQRSSHWESP